MDGIIMGYVSAHNRDDNRTSVGKAPLRGPACRSFGDQRFNCDLRCERGGWPNSAGVVGHSVALGLQLSQRAHPDRCCIRYGRRALRGPDQARIAQSRAALAILWISLVAISRLVLGVH